MAEKIKTIDWDTGLKARALFTLACEHYRKCREFEKSLGELLGIADDYGYMGCLSDAIYEDSNFDEGMKKSSIRVAPKKSQLSGREHGKAAQDRF